jgi:hypothetical protein
MNTIKSKLIGGLALILVTNFVVLAGVIYNRTGEPSNTITLTERELSLPYSWQGDSVNDSENSALFLRFEFEESKALSEMRLTKEKLTELGFSSFYKDDSYSMGRRTFYWALEYDGEEYAYAIKRAENRLVQAKGELGEAQQLGEERFINDGLRNVDDQQERLDRIQLRQSKLYVIDFDNDLTALQAKYANSDNIIFMQGLVNAYRDSYWVANYASDVSEASELEKEAQPTVYSLRFSALLVDYIHIPLDLSDPIKDLSARDYDSIEAERYSAQIEIGRRLEPTALQVKRLNTGKTE